MESEEIFDIERAIALFNEGKGWTDIAREVGTHPFSVQQKLTSLGYSRPQQKTMDLDVERAIEMRKQKYSYGKIAKELGVTETKVQRALSKVFGTRSIRSTERGVSFDVDRAVELYKEGKGWTDIGKEVGAHPYSVQRKLEKMGYDETNGKAGRKRNWDLEEAKRLRSKGLTFADIARILGVSESAVQKSFRRVSELPR